MRIIRIQKDRWKTLSSSEQTSRRSQENRRRSNEAIPRKDRNLSKERIKDPLSEGMSGQNNYSMKYIFKYREEH